MKLRCFFNRHPWNYRTVGEVVIRLCKDGCTGPQYWAAGQWKPLQPLREKKAPLLGWIHQTPRVTPSPRVGVGRETAEI